MPLAHYAEVLARKGYAYAEDILPHDAQARELGTGKSIEDLLAGMGRKVRIAPKLSVDQGIQAVRTMLPRIWFDERKCERGIAALRQYRAEYDEERKVLSNRPLHDWTSHACDAMRMFSVTHRDVIRSREQPVQAQRWIV